MCLDYQSMLTSKLENCAAKPRLICCECAEVVVYKTSSNNETVCQQCLSRRTERKETIQEIVQTEVNYGRDLKIILEEFYIPMKKANLLENKELASIFLNLEELVHVNEKFTKQLSGILQEASNKKDETSAIEILEQLERDREVLRAFLQVSQAENSLLRRMNLKSFLMIPVQRIMKYPLLLNRLYKSTAARHEDCAFLHEAVVGIEKILEEINAKTKSSGSMKLKRKRSELRRHSSTDKFELVKTALNLLEWNQHEVHDILVGTLLYTQPQDHFWTAKKCRNLKFTPVHALLLTRGEPQQESTITKKLLFTQQSIVRQAALVLLRGKGGRYQAVRDPLYLDKCVITVDPVYEEVFEVQDWNKESYLFKGEDDTETHRWVQQLKNQSKNLGVWWRRRNAVPDIKTNNEGPADNCEDS
ncbi:cell-transforming gene 1 [Octopus vulgaris]|uniref:Cell-transforming gene 1 n=1 Tax=Octopus vulgaris TaxID=6645 RepID=A0AA36EWY6_OCTVU|nr:cell-transforming gene 1 [Octopus vulgaris]